MSRPITRREVQQRRLVPERVLGAGQRVLVVSPEVVEFGDPATARSMPSSHSCHSAFPVGSSASVGGDHEQRAVRGALAGPEFPDEVNVRECR